jgi:PAS domain S-box-containing protein
MPEKNFKNRLIMGVVLPVLITGVLFSTIIIWFFLPPIIAGLRDQTDAALKHASNMGISICEERQNTILELRLEDNLEMDIASKKEAIEQIRQISRMSPGIQVMVLEKDGTVIASSFDVPVDRLDLGDYPRKPRDIISEKLGEIPVKLHYHYFPFWGWYVVSVIFEKDYMKPIQMARQTVLLGTFGVLSVVLAALLVLFIRRINRPLEDIIRATESVAKGNLKPMKVKGNDEISRVSMAFNAMVHSLIRDKEKISEAVRELERSEEQYKVLTESSLTNIAMIRNDEFVFANRRMLESLHYESSEFIGMSFRNIIHSADSSQVKQRIQDLKTGGPDMDHFECRVLSKNREIFWFEMIAALVLYRDQDTVLIHAIDITERKRTEEDVRSAHEKMLTILDSIDSTVYVSDMDTYEILFMNKRMITDFGGDKTGEICYRAFRENSEPCECCTNDQLVDKHGNPAGVCIWHDKNPVTGRYYINHDRAIEWTDGRLVRMQIATDITDLKKMETQLNQAQKMESVGRLAGGVAHDFNNMLGVILGHTELALLKADEDNDLISDLNEIQKAAKRSADITKQLLAFARKQTISPRQLDLNDTVESMLNMLRRLIGEDIDLVWQPSAHLWPLKMDPTQIDQILANLCVNARDAIDGVGKLTIETGKKTYDEEYCKEHAGFIPGDFVLLAVSDNGCGMDKDILGNLFEPFFTTKEVGKGTGLGLATIYGIVKQNNGFINVYSEPGQGSTFKIYLPRLVADEDTEKAVPEKKASAGGTETILLVEDEPMILDMTTTMLEMSGYTVLAAASPDEAIRLAKDHTGKIHLLMSDVVMPEMNGRDLAGQITALYPGIRLLFMSGYTANVIAHHGVLDDGVAFIQKPFSMADMTEKVRELLDMSSDKNQG